MTRVHESYISNRTSIKSKKQLMIERSIFTIDK